MNKKDLFWDIFNEKISSKNYTKFKLSKSSFYKVYKRVRFYKQISNPIIFMLLNLSEKEFSAVQNSKLKNELPSNKQFKSFSHMPSKLLNDAGETSD